MSRFQMDDFPEDDYYLSRMKGILEGYPKLGPLQHPSKLLEHVYIGNQDNADNLDLLQALEITHVLNCAGTRTFDLTRSPYRPDTGIIGFLMMPAEDYEEFDIMQYFMDAIIFLDKVKTTGGRALVHCNIGVNRSGAIAAAYLMVHQRRPLLKIIEDLKSKRSLILQNEGFRRQLVRFARCRSLLDVPDRPPKKPSFIASGYKGVNKEYGTTAVVTDSERSETVKNGNSNVADEVSRDLPSETTTNETNSDPLSNETPGEQNSCGGTEERRAPLPNLNSVGKYAGYENDLGNLDNKKERIYSNISYLDVPSMGSIRDDLDKVRSKVSYLDLGSFRPSTKTDHISSLNRSLSPLSLTSSTDLDLHLLSASSSRPLDSFRISGVDKIVSPVPSLSQRLSRESSISDTTNSLYASLDGDDFGGKYYNTYDKTKSSNIPLVSSSYFDYDDFSRNHPNVCGKASSSASDRFVSSVKPRSYYQRLVSPNPSRYPLDDIENDELTFADNVRSSFEKPLKTRSSLYEGGAGMLFVPYLASSKSPSTIHRNCFSYDTLSRPLSFADRNYTSETSSFSRNTPYNRMSLSDLDSVNPYDFPLRTTSTCYSSLRPASSSSSYRSPFEYDNAVDEYSDLLDASLGRSNAMGAAAKSRVRSGTSTGLRRSYHY